MNVAGLHLELDQEVKGRTYINRLEVIDQSVSLVKARLYVSPSLFIQVYRNDSYDTTNLILIYNGQRVYARDQLGGVWHRHTTVEPDLHNGSPEGRQSVTLAGFLDEVEIILAEMGLP
jgi:hypothetical protein